MARHCAQQLGAWPVKGWLMVYAACGLCLSQACFELGGGL
jgi:hypothetical protein